MRIAQLSRSTSRLNGGIFFAQTGLLPRMAQQGGADFDLRVFGSADAHSKQDRDCWHPLAVEDFPIWPPRNFVFSPRWMPALRAFRPELLHTHGLWTYASWASLRLHRQYGIPIIISPHGMLDTWALALSPLKKRLISHLFERAHLESAAAVHALNRAEARSIRAYGIKSPVVVIPNGVNLPSIIRPQERSAQSKRDHTLLFLGRLHPKKGLEPLLEAWAQFTRKGQSGQCWQLVIAGWDEARMEAQLRARASILSDPASVVFAGPLWGQKKAEAYAKADAFILPSLSEGLPMTVLEAWSHGKPALITPACNLPEGVSAGAAIEIDSTPGGIEKGLDRLAGMTEDTRCAMGVAGRRLVEQCFTWERAATDMLRVYRAVAAHTPLPSDLMFSEP